MKPEPRNSRKRTLSQTGTGDSASTSATIVDDQNVSISESQSSQDSPVQKALKPILTEQTSQSDEQLTFEKLLDIVKPVPEQTWMTSVNNERQSILFYQLNWAAETPRIAKSIHVTVPPTGDASDSPLIVTLFIGDKKLDAACAAIVLGHKGIRSEKDLAKLMDHVNDCPTEVMSDVSNAVVLASLSAGPSGSAPSIISLEQAKQLILGQHGKIDKIALGADELADSVYYLEQSQGKEVSPRPVRNGYAGEARREPISRSPGSLSASARKRRPVECDVCHQIYSTKHSMMLHRQSQHEHIRHTCEYCERSFSYKYDMFTHMTKAHPDVEGLGMPCEVCGVLTHHAVLEGHQKKCGKKVSKAELEAAIAD